MAVDASGNLYIADRLDNRIRKVSKNGIITTVAGRGDFSLPLGDGGPATSAALAGPLAVAVDASGNLYIADTFFFLIRKVSAPGIITTIAGNGVSGYSGDGGPANGASFSAAAAGIALDAAGAVYVADVFNYAIRALRPAADQ